MESILAVGFREGIMINTVYGSKNPTNHPENLWNQLPHELGITISRVFVGLRMLIVSEMVEVTHPSTQVFFGFLQFSGKCNKKPPSCDPLLVILVGKMAMFRSRYAPAS